MAFLTRDGAEYLFEKLSDAKNIKITGNINGGRVSDVVNNIVSKADNVTKAINKEVLNTTKIFKVGTGDVDVSSDVEDGFSELGIKGVTYQNLVEKYEFISSPNASYEKGVITVTPKVDAYSNAFLVKGNLFKPNTLYTVIFNVLENTLNDKFYLLTNHDSYGNTIYTSSAIQSIEAGVKGIFIYTIRTKDDISSCDTCVRSTLNKTATQGLIKYNVYIIEGDQTNNLDIPKYFEGIKGVGDKAENLFNPNGVKFSTYLDQNTGVESSNAFYVTSDFIPVIPETHYVIKGLSVIHYYNINKEQIAIKNTKVEGIIWTPKNCVWVRIRNHDQILINQQKLLIQKTMFALGYDQRFRPYYNGYGVEVVGCAENLWNPKINTTYAHGKDCNCVYEHGVLTITGIKDGSTEAYSNANFMTMDLKKNTRYYFHCKTDGVFGGSNATDTVECFTFGIDTGVYIKYNGNPEGFTFNTGNNNCIGFRFDANKNNTVHKFYDFVLTESSTKIECDPYKDDKIRFLLDEPLMRLPNGVCDEITKEGRLIRRIGKNVFDGDERIFKSSYGTNRFAIRVDDSLLGYTTNLICDKFKPGDTTKADMSIANHSIDNDINRAMYFSISSCESVDDFKTWLSNNPTTVYYELGTPVITQLNINQLRIFKDGYIKTNTFITPETTHVVQLNKSAQIEKSIKELQFLDNKVNKLEGLYDELLLTTSQKLDLLCLDFDLRGEDE